jgi:predicted kinase
VRPDFFAKSSAHETIEVAMEQQEDTQRGDGPRLVLICGLPGAGKTTLAKQLAERLPALQLCPDDWMTDLGLNLQAEASRERIESLFWGLARRVLSLGASVILESGFWLRSDRDEKRLGARALGVPVELHYLDLPIDELWRRIDARSGDPKAKLAPITRTDLEEWAAVFQPPDAAELALFDPPSASS